MKLRFVGDENKEIVVTLVNGRQFIVHTNWRKFHKAMVKLNYGHSKFCNNFAKKSVFYFDLLKLNSEGTEKSFWSLR